MRRLSEISDHLVPVGDRWWGKLYWTAGGPLGFEVRCFRDPALHAGYADMLDEAFNWCHRDPLAWRVLVIEPPHEIGEDFVMVRRYPGVAIDQFYPERTDDPVEPPIPQLALLAETIARMHEEAATPSDKLLAAMLHKRLAALDHRIVFDDNSNEKRFHLYDLDPDADELAAWIATPHE